MIRRSLIWATTLLISGPAIAADCFELDHLGDDYSVCTVTNLPSIQLWLKDDEGNVIGEFQSLRALTRSNGQRLEFAMNGGMYHEDRRPVGHFVSNGTEEMRVVTSEGPGNFGLLPNGVFCVNDEKAAVFESRAFAANQPSCRIATQSGPMLVIDNKIHPRFMPDSTSRKRRNGVGVGRDGSVHFVISDSFVRFHDFATLFRDVLDSPNALFLDGSISRLYAPQLGRDDTGARMGPIIGEVSPAQ